MEHLLHARLYGDSVGFPKTNQPCVLSYRKLANALVKENSLSSVNTIVPIY